MLVAGLRWIIVGAVLLVLWYILAPLITPKSLSQREREARPRRHARYHKRGRRKGQELEVIEGDGRVIE